MQRGCGVAGAMAAAFIQLIPFSTLLFLLSYCWLHNVEHLVDRKVMFLFCNAIVLFVARDSGLLVLQEEQPALVSSESFDRGSSSVPHPQVPRTEEKGSAAKRGDEGAAEGAASLDLAAGEAMSLENSANWEESEDAEADDLHQKIEKGSAAKRGHGGAVEGAASLDLAAGEAMSSENSANREESEDAEADDLHQKIEKFIEKVKRQRRTEALQLATLCR